VSPEMRPEQAGDSPLDRDVADELRASTLWISSIPPASRPPNRRRQLIIAACLAATLAVIVGFYVWDSLRKLDEENAQLMGRLNELERSLKKASRQREFALSLEDWQRSHVNWLDELRDFAQRFPSSRDAMILHLALSPLRDGGGEMELSGVLETHHPAAHEDRVRDESHQVRSQRVQERVQEKNYTWQFEQPHSGEASQPGRVPGAIPRQTAPSPDRGENGKAGGTVPVATGSTPAYADSSPPAKEAGNGR